MAVFIICAHIWRPELFIFTIQRDRGQSWVGCNMNWAQPGSINMSLFLNQAAWVMFFFFFPPLHFTLKVSCQCHALLLNKYSWLVPSYCAASERLKNILWREFISLWFFSDSCHIFILVRNSLRGYEMVDHNVWKIFADIYWHCQSIYAPSLSMKIAGNVKPIYTLEMCKHPFEAHELTFVCFLTMTFHEKFTDFFFLYTVIIYNVHDLWKCISVCCLPWQSHLIYNHITLQNSHTLWSNIFATLQSQTIMYYFGILCEMDQH